MSFAGQGRVLAQFSEGRVFGSAGGGSSGGSLLGNLGSRPKPPGASREGRRLPLTSFREVLS
jgi:hypothetical protein